jgi:riboflavin biosynthesis pyrimidine reductase
MKRSTAAQIREAYDTPRHAHPDGRPWVGVCMVASLDGSVVVDGASGALGNPTDQQVLATLRGLADVIIVGAGTVRAEGYGPPKKPGQRIGVVTNSGAVDLETELFRSGAGFLIAPESAPIDERLVDVIRAGETSVDLEAALALIPDLIPNAVFAHAEGGPGLNASLLGAGLLDELNLTTSPRLVGGGGARLTVGAPAIDQPMELAHLLADDDGFVFSRWVRC